jgi:hypothetical protein
VNPKPVISDEDEDEDENENDADGDDENTTLSDNGDMMVIDDVNRDDSSDDGYDSDGLPIRNKPQKSEAGFRNTKTATGSMFMTLLNSGYISGDSDDHWEDPDFDKYYGTIKKNRSGQRARRKLVRKIC